MRDWDRYGLDEAWWQSRNSRDGSTNVGACILRQDNSIAGTGWNGFPRRISDAPDRLADRDTKLMLTLHAEENAILSAKEDLAGMTMYVWPFHPCAHCAAAIIQKRIGRVVAPAAHIPDRWEKSFSLGRDILKEAGVQLVLLPYMPPFQAEPSESQRSIGTS